MADPTNVRQKRIEKLLDQLHYAIQRATKVIERNYTEARAELFRVQCRIHDLGTDTSLSAAGLREQLMSLRQDIIDFREATLMKD